MTDLLHTDLAFLPVLFSRNELTHVIDAADPNLTSRVGLKYYLEIQLPDFPLSETFVPLHRSEGPGKARWNQRFHNALRGGGIFL